MSNNNKTFYPQTVDITQLQNAYNQGQYLTAYTQAVALSPLSCWRGKEGRLLAARIARMMNQNSLSRVLTYRAWKEYPDDAETIYELARNKRSQGMYRAWLFIQRYDQAYTREPLQYARWLALKGNIAARLRNFKKADEYIQRALELTDDPWVWCEQAYILEFEDRYDESLQVIEKLFEQHNSYRPAYQQRAYLLQLMRRDEEARLCLQEAYNKFESIHVGAQWLDELIEGGQYEEALSVCNELDLMVPVKRRHEFDWLLGRRVDTLCHLKQYKQAGELVSGLSSHFFTRLAENLQKAGEGSIRKVLPVHFIRQQHNTCGPATMSAICHYHGSDVDQQAIIDSIWYAGTRDLDERQWCLENGWQVTEFKLTWDSVRSLIDAGFPVAVTTVEPDSAHLQAVIGYDEYRGTLLIRDPYEREEQEFLAEGFFTNYAVHGPRALLIYPQQKAALLEPIELVEQGQYDAYFHMQSALEKHMRGEALAILKQMESSWPNSRMSLHAR
ncbi:MAG: C39 family peptidase, partial [Gammaproteobacteria bacterium]|nr:C39 family peptidase [Gammaproteobacteria bacterium]